jgi:hypothetical protein
VLQTSMGPRLAASDFGGPVVLQSEEANARIDGEVFALLDQPFALVSATLADPDRWCDILILHLNTKGCRHVNGTQGNRIEMRVGKKAPQRPEDASLLAFRWQGATQRPDYVSVQMDCLEGPYDTRDYRLVAEAVPLENGRTFLHMGYAFSWGGASSFAMKIYLATVARDKIGFTRLEGKPIGGVRAIAERNTMRYYLAINSYLDSQSAPAAQQAEKRMAQWFDSTEKYAPQLHEIDRADYLAMKREEIRRLAR